MSRSSSAVVDSKVVEMTLENTNFEQNATKSLSTLQKLKEALNFSNHKDGLDKAGAALKKIDANTLTAGLQAAKNEFGALDKISFGFFSKLGGQIESTTMKYAQMFSGMKQATDGFAEYELKMGSVQTILMGAKTKEGLPVTLDMVNQKLDELNTYADKTIYSFSDMTASIGKFTNAGVDLDTAVAAIQGISNEAALSGANAQQASHAMYNFAQALSSGYVKLIDWKSIENANMATVDFKQTLIDTALELGTIKKEGDKFVSTTTDMNGKVSEAFNSTLGFNDSLSAQWMTTDVLTAALGKYADESTEVGKKAFQAATEVKTFHQLLDTLQEAAGSGWAQTWELLVGDFEESKSLFTMLSKTFGGIIDAQAKNRNALLEEGLGAKKGTAVTEEYFKSLGMGAVQSNTLRKSLMELGEASGVAFKSNDARGFFESLDSGWLTVDMLKKKMEELNGVGTEGPDGMTKSLDEMKEAALKVIRGGDSGYSVDMAERFKQLTEDGFDPDKIQAYVNEIHKLSGGTWDVTDAIMEEAAANVGLNETMTESSGLFDDILGKVTTEGSGKASGRELLFDALVTSIFAFKKILGSIKGAFREVFPPATGETVYKIAEGINNASKALRRFALKNAENIRKVFLAIFKTLDLVLRTGKAVVSGVFGGLKKAFSGGSGAAGQFITKIADLISKFHDWVVENEIIEKTVAKVSDTIAAVITTIGGWIDAIGKIPQVQNILTSFGETFGWIGKNVGPVFEKAGDKLSLFGGKVARAFENADSPEEFFKRIKATFDGLWSDISSSEIFGKIKESFSVLGENIKTFFNDLGNNEDGTRNTFGKILDSVSNFKTKFMQILSGVDENGEKIDIFKGIKDAFTGLWDDLSASGIGDKIKGAFDTVKQAIDNFFTSIGTSSDGSLNAFGRVYEALKNAFDWIIQKAGAAKTAILDFFSQYKVGEFFSNMWANLTTGFGDFFGSLPEFFSGFKTKFGEFIGKVKDLGGFKEIFNPEKFGDIWKAFKDTVGKFFKDANIFEPIKTAFENIKASIVEHFGDIIEKIKAKFASIGENFGGIGKIISNIKDSLSLSFEGLEDGGPLQAITSLFTGSKVQAAERKASKFGKSLKKSGKDFKTFFSSVKESFTNSTFGQIVGKIATFFGRLGNALLEVKPDTIFSIIKAFVAFKVIKGVWNEIKGFVGDFVDSITGLWDSMAAKNKAKANLMNKAALLELAAAIAIVGYVIYQLSQIEDMEKAWNAFGILAAMLGVMFVVSLLMSKLVKNDMTQIGAGLILFGIACAAIGYAIKEVASIEHIDKAWSAFGILAAVLAVAAVVMIIGSKLGAGAASFGAAMIEMAAAFLITAIALKVFESVDFEACVQNLVDAVKAWNDGIKQIESDGIDLVKSAALLAQLKGIAWVLKDAAIDGFIIAVGDFVSGLIGQGTVMENFGEGVKGLVDAIVIWNTEIQKVPLDAVGALQTGVFLLELNAISKVLLSATIAGFIGALGHFVTDLMGQDPPMAQFKQGVQDLVDSIVIWNRGMDELPPNGWNVLKSAVFLTELAAITGVLGAAEIVGFLNAVMTFVTNLLGQKPPMAQFKQGIQDLLDSIKIWNDGIAEISFDFGSYMKGLALLSTLAGITLVLGAAEITAFLGAVMDFVYGAMGGKQTVMEKFKHDVGILIQVITDWQDTTGKVNAVEANELTQAVDNIVTVLDHISTSGFWTRIEEFITGGGDFVEDFKTDATSLGEAVTNFIGAFKATPEETDKATKIVDALAKLGDNMSMFVIDSSAMGNGMMNIDNFGDAMVRLGDKLTQFVNNSPDSGTFVSLVSGFRSMVNATQVLAEMDLDTGDFFDDEKIQTMRTNVSILTGVVYAASAAGAMALGVPLFTAALGFITGITISSGEVFDSGIVNKVTSNVGKLVSMINGDLKNLDTSGVDKFTSSLEKINSAKIAGAAQKIAEANKATAASGSGTGKQMSDSIAKGIDSNAISSAADKAVSSAIRGINVSGYSQVGSSISARIGLGIVNSASRIKSSVASAVSSAKNSLGSFQSDFFNVGRNFAIGLGNGISQNRSSAINAAIDTAARALAAAKQKLQINSPSKATEEVGKFFDLGFARGINRFGAKVYDESTTVAALAMGSLRNASEAINDILSDEVSSPVITPVIDLSQVESGAGAISNLFNTSPTSVLGNLSAIGYNADAMREVGRNDDILTALENLGGILGSSRGDTYNINGVTYDDGSNVSSAVEQLIRAAKIERRA